MHESHLSDNPFFRLSIWSHLNSYKTHYRKDGWREDKYRNDFFETLWCLHSTKSHRLVWLRTWVQNSDRALTLCCWTSVVGQLIWYPSDYTPHLDHANYNRQSKESLPGMEFNPVPEILLLRDCVSLLTSTLQHTGDNSLWTHMMGINLLSYPSVGILPRKQGSEESSKPFPSPH